eukprot:1168166-Prymnesium_polylepis.1
MRKRYSSRESVACGGSAACDVRGAALCGAALCDAKTAAITPRNDSATATPSGCSVRCMLTMTVGLEPVGRL